MSDTVAGYMLGNGIMICVTLAAPTVPSTSDGGLGSQGLPQHGFSVAPRGAAHAETIWSPGAHPWERKLQ